MTTGDKGKPLLYRPQLSYIYEKINDSKMYLVMYIQKILRNINTYLC